MFKRRRRADDFAQEIRAHLALEADELQSEGVSAEEARRKARVEFGSVCAAQERLYLRTRLQWLDNLVHDIKFALRQFVKHPGFAATAIAVLAIGIGASTAFFGFVDAALLQPLPYPNPGRLMSVNESNLERSRWPLSYPDYLDWQTMNRSFRSLDIYGGIGYLLATPSGAEQVQGERVSGSFFRTLGVHPMLGRDFNPGEDRPGGPDVVLLSYGAWLKRFAGRRDVVGQTVDLDNRAFVIIGVLPRGFSFAPGGSAEFWVPINVLSPHEQQRGFYNFWGIGRLRDGAALEAAQAEMSAIAKRLQQQYGIVGRNLGASVIPLSQVLVGEVRPILLLLLGGAALLLLIACVNVAGLVLVRSESRRREIAVRGALGATPARLVRQFVSEALLLVALGSLAGVMVAAGITRLVGGLVSKPMAANMPFLQSAGLNAHTAAFAAIIALLAALLLAATPALRLAFGKIRDGLAEGDRGAAGLLWRRLGANLVVLELAIAVVLLAGAGLLGQSLYRLLHVRLGFDPNHLATLQVMAPATSYQSDEQRTQLYQEVERSALTLPGAQSAGLTSLLPVQCNCAIDAIQILGRPNQEEAHNQVDERHVSPGYLSTLGATLVRGRFFTQDDNASKPGVAVINQALARKYFPNESPVGRRFSNTEGGRLSVWEIVGEIADIREGPLDVDLWPAEYFPLNQTHDNAFSLAVRTRSDADALLPFLVSSLHRIDLDLGISDEATMNEKIDTTQAAILHRLVAFLVGGFAVIALVLGVVGVYGVIAYSVSHRTREIGVRMALGAQRGSVYRLILRQAAWLTGTGLAVGLVCWVGAALLVRNLLFGVQAWDAATLGCVAGLLGAASMAAAFLPARRAASVNPVEALRAE